MTSEPVPSRAEGTVIHTLGAERRDRVQLPVNLNCAPAPGTQGRRGRGGSRRGRRHRGSLGRASRPLVPQACPFHGAHRRFLMNDLLSFPISLNSAPTPACGSSSHLKSTPAATPCTPRRLSLAESFTNARESTTTMSTSLGLVWLLKERGISAAVYDPQSWNRAGGGPLLHSYTPRMAVIPSTPPNSPMQTPTSSPPSFEFKCTSLPYDNFLASKPASSILREVREKKNVRSSESQTDVSVSNLNLVDKVRRFGVARVVNSGRAHVPSLTEDQGPLLCGPPGPAQGLVPAGLVPEGLPLGCPTVTSAIGGLQLNSGIRRNRSFPTMVGSSMQMKAPVTLTSGILMGAKLPKQTSLR